VTSNSGSADMSRSGAPFVPFSWSHLSAVELRPREIHVWAMALEHSPEAISRFRQVLCANEVERADRFRFERDRRRFTASHFGLRTLLGAYAKIPPQSIAFEYGEKGKPSLSLNHGEDLQFNLSHSGELALMAFCRREPLGVDVEQVRSMHDLGSIAERFFSSAECTCLFDLPEEERETAFFRCWTRKEALIKAFGEGLSMPLDCFDVTLGPSEAPALLRLHDDNRADEQWSLFHFEPQHGYVGALAIRQKAWSITARKLELIEAE
jgi:4'-phosphopantetheinyl transferase